MADQESGARTARQANQVAADSRDVQERTALAVVEGRAGPDRWDGQDRLERYVQAYQISINPVLTSLMP